MSYKVIGKVTSGNRIGRKLGFPTANIPLPASTTVKDGVYAGTVEAEGRSYKAMINVGRKPTVGGDGGRWLEAHLFGFEGDLYDKTINVNLLEFMRNEEKFDDIIKLKEKIEADRLNILNYFNNI